MLGVVLVFLTSTVTLWAASPERPAHATRIRMGNGRTIVAITPGRSDTAAASRSIGSFPNPRPRLAGFSPLVAIATSDEGHPLGFDLEFEHDLQSTYVGSSLIPGTAPDYVIGFLDSGADVNLAAGSFAVTLGLFGNNLTGVDIPIGGVGNDEVLATITMSVGFFAQGLSAINSAGALNFADMVGHSNVCGLASPAIDCGNGEVLSAVIGMPFLAFYNSLINVDTPRRVEVGGEVYTGPDVRIQDPFEPLPQYAHLMFMEFGGLAVSATTAAYFPDFLDLVTPALPTLLALFPGTFPTGGNFFAEIELLEGEPGPFNTAISVRLLLDTGAQSSIISRGVAARLNQPFDPDFTSCRVWCRRALGGSAGLLHRRRTNQCVRRRVGLLPRAVRRDRPSFPGRRRSRRHPGHELLLEPQCHLRAGAVR